MSFFSGFRQLRSRTSTKSVFCWLGDTEVGQSVRSPVFETQLTNQCLLQGQTALFECVVSGHPAPEIVWTRRGHPLLDKARYSVSSQKNYISLSTGNNYAHPSTTELSLLIYYILEISILCYLLLVI